jgi:hypothetical protein
MPEPGPLGETFFEARVLAMLGALRVNNPAGGWVESVLTFTTHRLPLRFLVPWVINHSPAEIQNTPLLRHYLRFRGFLLVCTTAAPAPRSAVISALGKRIQLAMRIPDEFDRGRILCRKRKL